MRGGAGPSRLRAALAGTTCLAALGLPGSAAARAAVLAPNRADTALVAVRAYHLRQEASLAALASARAPDPAFRALARHVGGQTANEADRLDGQLRRWAISPAAAANLRRQATTLAEPGHGPARPLSCSLLGPTSAPDRLQLATPDDVASAFAQSEFTAALEGEQLVVTAVGGGALTGPTVSQARAVTHAQQAVIRALSSYLLPTDRAYASGFTSRA